MKILKSISVTVFLLFVGFYCGINFELFNIFGMIVFIFGSIVGGSIIVHDIIVPKTRVKNYLE